MKIKLITFVLALSLIGLFGIISPSYATNQAGVSPTPIKLASLDSDKDGYSDLCEVLHKTNPNDSESKPSPNITINVPSDVKTIQEAINASIDGDTIAVSQGKYQGNINFNGKSITITSTDSLNSDVVANTIIEGTESGSVVTIDSNSILKGFTVTSEDLDCRGIYVKDTSPIIENCTIIDNQTTESGGGIYMSTSSSPKITNCIITRNSDSIGTGESAQVSGGTPQISYSLIGQGLVNSSEPTSTTTETATTTEPTLTSRIPTPRTPPINNEVISTATASTTTGGLSVVDLSEGITKEDLVWALVSNLPGVNIANVTYTGNNRAAGIFTGGGTDPDTEVGIEYGIVLGSGKVRNVVGPNDSIGTSTYYGLAGDTDLAAIIPVDPGYTHDAAVLEFDFTANANIINFRYVFSSEEYNEWVGQFNDLFGWFVNGIQSALLPDGLTYIGVATINNGTNPEFYRNNASSPYPINCEMDGLTTVLTLQAPINPAPQINHIKIVIADIRDEIYDSNVFIEHFAERLPPIWHVDDSQNNPPGDGQSWDTAFKYLEDALNNPLLATGDEIWVAQGIYKPDNTPPYDRTATFQLINGVAIKGGYAGFGAPYPDERNIVIYPTILSGDLSGNDGNPPNFDYYGDNSYTVVTGPDGGTLETVIDGLTITGGNNDRIGGSIQGGGMVNIRSPFLTISNCIFRENHSIGDGVNTYGGAISNRNAGISPYNHSPNLIKIINCFFVNNAAGGGGGAIWSFGSVPTELTNCVFTGNFGSGGGGAIYTVGSKNNPPKLTNCTFYNNNSGRGVANSIAIYQSNPIITNCIFWDGGNEIFNGYYTRGILCTPLITSCDIQGSGGSANWNTSIGIDGGDNIDADPLFVDTGLLEGPNGIFCTSDDGLRLDENSPCIDVADDSIAPNTDILGTNRFGIADIGAYEFNSVWTILEGFYSPRDIYYDNTPGEGYIYVADTFNNRIVKTNIEDTDQTTYGSTSGLGVGQFYCPHGIYYDNTPGEEYIYVADTANDRIVKTKIDGTGWTTYGTSGSGVGQFSCPHGIYYDNTTEYIYVADTGNHRIVKTKIDGTGWWNTLGGFYGPTSICYDNTPGEGYIYVADTGNHRIVKTRIDGTGRTTYGTRGSGVGQFNRPCSIYYDNTPGEGYIYVSDTYNHRIVKTKIDGTGWTTYGTSGSGVGQFSYPHGIYYDSAAGYIVADSGNNRIVRVFPPLWE